MKKGLLILFGLTLVLSGLMAGGSAEKTDSVSVLIWSGPEHQNLLKTAPVFEEKYGIKLDIEEVARDTYFDKIKTLMVSNSSDYDVFYSLVDEMPAMVAAGGMADISGYIDDQSLTPEDFDVNDLKPGVDFYKINDRIYGLPSEGDTAWFWYRKDLLKEAGLTVPQTWDEFYNAANVLNDPDSHYGAVIGASTSEAVWDFMHYHFGHGGSILDPDNNVVINNEAGKEALEMYVDLRKEGLTSPGVVNYGYNEILTMLKEGKAAMGIEWMAATAELTDPATTPAVTINGENQLGYTLVPGVRNTDGTIERGMGGSQFGWSLFSQSKNQENGFKFIAWQTGLEGAKLWALNGGIPSNVKALSDPEVIAEQPQFELLAEAMPYRNIFPTNAATSELVTIYNDLVHNAVAGEIDPSTGLDEAAEKMEEALVNAGVK
jgi:ABC-type glycerol-3-phosphate transport system substrate-binding protein